MSDKAAFVSSVYSRYRAQPSNVNVISPAGREWNCIFNKSVQVVIAASQSVWFTKQTYFACYKKMIYSRGT